jgi:hypothetical protein
MTAYRGLSGIDSALFGLLTVLLIREALEAGDRRGLLLAGGFSILFAGKTAFELVSGAGVFVSDFGAAVSPVPLAHLAGAAVGAAAALVRRRALPGSAAQGLVPGLSPQ